MVHIGTANTAETARQARLKEYSQYVATEDIFINGVLAFAPGYPVPASHVEQYPELLDEEAVAKVEQQAPAANARRDDWVEYARGKGADEADLADLKDGGLSRKDLAAKYGAGGNENA